MDPNTKDVLYVGLANSRCNELSCIHDDEHVLIFKLYVGIAQGCTTMQGSDPVLHIAIREKRVENVKILLKYRGDPNLIDAFGTSPLHKAASEGSLPCVKCCLSVRLTRNLRTGYICTDCNVDRDLKSCTFE